MDTSLQEQAVPEYLEGIKARFPEFTDYTNEELIVILDTNADRKFGVYEYEIESALKDLDSQVVFDDDQHILDYIPNALLDSVDSGLNYIVTKHEGVGDLVLNIRKQGPVGGWQSTVGSPVFAEDFSFIVHSKDKDYLSPDEEKKLLLVLSIKKTAQHDSLGRPILTLIPKLIEIPSKNSLLLQGMMFQKRLSAQEFDQELHYLLSY